ncbi:MAG TPA: DUF433 domain-containing protein [Fimbriimonadaceae bacterium]|jgi:uncharacterized protein (DUF433 family)
MDYSTRIIVDREIRFGKPIIKGTRICVTDVLDFLGAGDSEADVIAEFPQLTGEDVRACLAYDQ